MKSYVQQHLGAKLFLSYLAIVAIGMVVLVITSQSILPSSFSHHMQGMGMDQMMGMGRQGPSAGSPGTTPQLFADFRSGFNEALTYAALVAVIVALALSLFFSRSMVASLRAMMAASQHIAEGKYDERVEVHGDDELAQLAARFNLMAGKLQHVESMRRQLIGDVSHELRTPLTAIKGSMEGLIDGVLPANAETYAQIHAEADRLNRLVDDLQELSRVEAGAYRLDIRAVDISGAAQTIAKRLGGQFESRDIALHVSLAPNLPRVMADEDRLVQILTNLVGNALQYTGRGGTVTVTAAPTDHEVAISVSDTGIGIPPEHLGHIFDRFYRVDKSRSRRAGGGSGIGLTIARALVEAQGGRIRAESAGTGQGSKFTFTLPRTK